jgi:hypothetical protein
MPRRKREDGSGQGGLHHVLLVGAEVPPTERVVDLAEQPYDRDRPEIPGDVHAERQALAREVLRLTKRLDKAATPGKRKPAAIDRSQYEVMRHILKALATRLDIQLSVMPGRPRREDPLEAQARALGESVAELRKLTSKALEPALRRLVKQSKARATSPPPSPKNRTKTTKKKRGPKAAESLGCAVPGCTGKPQWKLACPAHLRSLPADLRSVVMDRGTRGPAKPGWTDAAAKARKLLGRG